MQVKTLDSLAASGVLKDKRVLIRSDLNVPRNDEGAITNDARIVASLPAIKTALLAGAAVMVTSHLGRPKEGVLRPEDSLQVVADRLGELLGREVPVVQDWIDGVEVKPGELVVLENCRCNVGEKKCDEALSKKYAALCDVYVNDAFGTAHRAEATTVGVAKYAPIACAGPLMAKEIEALSKALGSPSRPLAAIVAGSKVSTKLTILSNLAEKVDRLIVGGGILNILKDLNVGFAQFISIGNQADVNAETALEYWENDPDVKQILLYMESIPDPANFRKLATRISKKSPSLRSKPAARPPVLQRPLRTRAPSPAATAQPTRS